jgi:hypothetical protein
MLGTFIRSGFVPGNVLRTFLAAHNSEELYLLRQRIGKRVACTHTLLRVRISDRSGLHAKLAPVARDARNSVFSDGSP